MRALFLCFLALYCNSAYAQDQNIADSLMLVYQSGEYSAEDEPLILKKLAKEHTDPNETLLYSEKLLKVAELSGNIGYILDGYIGIGVGHRMMGAIPEALENFFKASEIAIENNMKVQLGLINVNIGDTYSVSGNHSLAINYYNQGIPLLRGNADTQLLASSLYNLGDEYYIFGNLDSALFFYQEAQPYFIELKYELGLAYTLGNIGQVLTQQGQYEEAEVNLNQAIIELTPLGDYYAISVYLLSLSEIYLARNQDNKALEYAEKSLRLAEEYGLKEQIRDANLRLSEIYEKTGDLQRSMFHFKSYGIYRDSINNLAVVQEMAELRNEFEVAQKQIEIDLLTTEAEVADLRTRRQRWIIFGTVLTLILLAVLAINAIKRYRFVQKTNLIIEEEKNRSDLLLLNILPEETAIELKEQGSVKARRIENVTVLFTDFVEFTRLSERVPPEQMVRSIDYYFKQFDEITSRYKLEKIKTIGDSYMCAGGLHSNSCRAKAVVKAAFEMIEVTENAKESQKDLINFDMRIGIHTGPIVAGIVGTKKWQYDIWGDTVNIASGMESNSSPGRINISETTHQEVKDEFKAEYRGKIEIKNRGLIKMYFLS